MIDSMRVCAIIAAAGMSHRMKSAVNKTFIIIDGKPVLAHTIEKFEQCDYVDEILIIARAEELEHVKREIIDAGNYKKIKKIVPGGKTRQESIKNGLRELPDEVDIVLTHDGARPFIKLETINMALESVLELRACVVGVPVKDTIKSVDEGSTVIKLTPNRSLLWCAQSPQVFYAEDLRRAYVYSEREHIEATDDSSLVEKLGIPVSMVQGTYDNIKITTPEDLVLAEMFIQSYKGELNADWSRV